MPRLQRPLDPQAVKAANDAIRAETSGRRLTMSAEDAPLRKKWAAAYLAAGGKEAPPFNSRPVKKAQHPCPNKNWIEVEYLYADDRILNDKKVGVASAICVVREPGGAVITKAKLNVEGFTRIDGIPDDLTEVEISFDNDPPKFEIFDDYKPILNPLPAPNPEFVENAGLSGSLRSLADLAWNDVKDKAEWVGGALAGDFNEDPDMGQIALGTVVTLIPFVDQAGDVRDLTAALKKLIWEKRYDDTWVWFDLVITLIGCIPLVGTVLKGIAKAIKRGSKGLDIAETLRHLNWVGKGNGVRWLKEQADKLPEYGTEVARKIKEILDNLKTKLETVKRFATDNVGRQIDEILDSINEVKKRVDSMVPEVIKDVQNKFNELLSKLRKTETPGTTQSKNVIQQEKAALEVAADIGKGVTKQTRKVLALGLRDRAKGVNYKEWAEKNGWMTYAELSEGGSFSVQIVAAIRAADDIHFNLDGVNVHKAYGKINDHGEPVKGYTNLELWHLKNNTEGAADKVIWYKNGKPMEKGYNPFDHPFVED